MITIDQYFQDKDRRDVHVLNARNLLGKVNTLLSKSDAYKYWIDPDTDTQISGAKGGSGDGGYRAYNSNTGAPSSAHKSGLGIDIYDPERILAQWCVNNQDELDRNGLYCEDFRWTPGWCHFQSIPPKSGHRIYIPSMKPPLAPALNGQKTIPERIR